jgi:rare lipoprotein A (peptidoglycan hydrolase)
LPWTPRYAHSPYSAPPSRRSCRGSSAAAAEEASQNVEAVAKKVEKRAERTEKADGKHDLVEDAVRTKTGTGSEKVIEQVGEASYYGKGFHERRRLAGK